MSDTDKSMAEEQELYDLMRAQSSRKVFGHPIARELKTWWEDHGGQHDDPLWHAYIDDKAELSRLKGHEQKLEHSNDGRFGMSKAGGCTRAAALKLLGHDAEPYTGDTLVTFAIGHEIEVIGLATLRACGYDVATHNADGKQFTVTIDPIMASAYDGKMVLGDREVLISVKSIGYKMSGKRFKKGEGATFTRHGFAELPLLGIKQSKPDWWAQSQAEMHGSGLTASLVLVIAKDMVMAMGGDPLLVENGSQTFYAELIEYDAEWCWSDLVPAWEMQWQDVQSGNAGTPHILNGYTGSYVRIHPDKPEQNKERTGKGYSPCDYCNLREACTVSEPLSASIEARRTA